jgi:quinol-cytochrome oxidoreductase complex cytochrome b subunit
MSEKAGKRRKQSLVPIWPHLVVQHAVIAGATLLVVLVLSIAFNAPLQEMANPNLTPEVAKAPWYFDGLQELLVYFHPTIAGVLLPAAFFLVLTLIPYIDRSRGWRLRDRKLLAFVFFTLLIAAATLTIMGALFRGPEWRWVWPWDHLYLEL